MKKLIEELTKVNPSELSEEAYKLFKKINEIIDENRALRKDNQELKNEINNMWSHIPRLDWGVKNVKNKR